MQEKNVKLLKESTIQKQVKDAMQRAGWIVNKIIQCTNNGWPDLECYKDGVTVFIECKRPGGKVSPLQQYRHDILRRAGFKVLIIDNIEQLCTNTI